MPAPKPSVRSAAISVTRSPREPSPSCCGDPEDDEDDDRGDGVDQELHVPEHLDEAHLESLLALGLRRRAAFSNIASISRVSRSARAVGRFHPDGRRPARRRPAGPPSRYFPVEEDRGRVPVRELEDPRPSAPASPGRCRHEDDLVAELPAELPDEVLADDGAAVRSPAIPPSSRRRSSRRRRPGGNVSGSTASGGRSSSPTVDVLAADQVNFVAATTPGSWRIFSK